MHLNEVNIALGHKITGGGDFQWHCYGSNVWVVDYENKFGFASVVFDTTTQMVYEAIVEIIDQDKAYRYIDPDHKQDFLFECTERGIDPNHAWDNVKYTDLEIAEDFLEKAQAIFQNRSFDERIQVPLDLPDQEFLQLALEAHKRDITINKMVEVILQTYVDGASK